MSFIDVEVSEGERGFWILTLSFLYLVALVQFMLGEHLLGISTLGIGVVFSTIAYQRLKEE
jgi:hypothetical protein